MQGFSAGAQILNFTLKLGNKKKKHWQLTLPSLPTSFHKLVGRPTGIT